MPEAITKARSTVAPEIGEKIGLQHIGATPVTLPDGTETQRNAWKVRNAGDLAYDQLERRLSRSGAKETTLDYTRDFAERRGIAESLGIRSEIEVPREALVRDGSAQRREREALAGREQAEGHAARSPQKIREDLAQDLRAASGAGQGEDRAERPPEAAAPRRRSMFDGLRLNAGSKARSAEADPGRPERDRGLRQASAPEPLAARLRQPSPLEAAIDRYAKAYASAHRQLAEGLPLLDMQKRDFIQAGAALDQFRPGVQDLMRSALKYDPEMHRDLMELSGRDRVRQVIEGLRHEEAQQRDPQVRADRVVDELKDLQAQRDRLDGWRNAEARGKVEADMADLVKGLERDPQVESLVRARAEELGLQGMMRRDESLSHALERSLSRGRGHGMEL